MPDPADRAAASRRDAIQNAIQVIGGGDAKDRDRVITPAEHAARSAESAPDLAAVLSSSATEDADPSVLLEHFRAWTSLAALGVAGQAWGARMANEEATAQDRRNAERYGRSRVALDRVYERLDEVRAAVAAGHPEVMTEFVQAVHEQLSPEHRQWLEEMHGAGTAIGRLEELLHHYRDEGNGSARAGSDAPDAGA